MTLTAEQLSVVNLVSGRHLVLAPPGSGKTEMLSQRILRALVAGVDAQKMLCATFTNRAAFEMRDRVSAAAGPDRTLPDVGNLHHFCHRFLLSVGRLHPGNHVLDEAGQLDFIREVTDVLRAELHDGAVADLRKTHGVSVMPTIKDISEEKRRLLHDLVEEFFAEYAEDDRSPYPDILSAVLIARQWRLGIPSCYLRQMPPQLHELLGRGVVDALERAYAGLKRKFQAVDFDDLVNETFLYLAKNPLPDDRRFDWVQIDEVQDLNPLQWRIVGDLTSSHAVSVYFGDVEQSIFSFLGASESSFAAATADCRRHFFKTNFRATPILLEILMRYSLDALRSDWDFLPTPSDVNRTNGEMTLSAANSSKAVVGRVRHLLDGGIAESVAILVRTNREADTYEQCVRGLGYRTVKVSGRDLFAYPPMRDFLAFVSLFAEKPSRTAWASLVRRFADGIYRSSEARYFVRAMFASGWEPMSLFNAQNPVPAVPHPWDRPRQWAWRNRSQLSSLRKRLKSAYDEVLPSLGFSLFGCGTSGALSGTAACFSPSYAGYYLRRSRGEGLSDDWLRQWERLAKAYGEGCCPAELVEPALRSNAGAVVRMALKTLRHHPDRTEARRQWLAFLATPYAETSIGCLQGVGLYDAETVQRIRSAALAAQEERTHRAALAYFKRGVSCASDVHALLLAALGDFIYHRRGEIRLEAVTALSGQGVTRWHRTVRGASSDFTRLQLVDDVAHEESIRTILTTKLPAEYERR